MPCTIPASRKPCNVRQYRAVAFSAAHCVLPQSPFPPLRFSVIWKHAKKGHDADDDSGLACCRFYSFFPPNCAVHLHTASSCSFLTLAEHFLANVDQTASCLPSAAVVCVAATFKRTSSSCTSHTRLSTAVPRLVHALFNQERNTDTATEKQPGDRFE